MQDSIHIHHIYMCLTYSVDMTRPTIKHSQAMIINCPLSISQLAVENHANQGGSQNSLTPTSSYLFHEPFGN